MRDEAVWCTCERPGELVVNPLNLLERICGACERPVPLPPLPAATAPERRRWWPVWVRADVTPR